MNLLLFEFKKLFRSKLVLYFLVFSLIAVTLLFVRNVWQQERVQAEKIDYFSKFARDVSMELQGNRKVLEDNSLPALEEQVRVGSMLYSQLNEVIFAIQSQRTMDEVTKENLLYEKAKEYKVLGGTFHLSDAEMDRVTRLNDQLIREGLPKEDLKLTVQPLLFTQLVLSYAMTGFGFLALLLILLSSVTGEYEEKNVRLVYTLPFSRSRYMLIKLGSFLVVGLVWLTVVALSAYVLASQFTEAVENQSAYPFAEVEGNWIQIVDVIPKGLLLGGMSLILVLTFGWFIAYTFRSTLLSYLIAILVVAGGALLVMNGGSSPWNPLSALQVQQTLLEQYLTQWRIYLLLLVSIALLVVGTLSINRKRGV
ncbi:ABC transporter permease subunit [Paenisporosarcina macmurdoensis]|uniref:ABC transporter permease subunit n=1 Tax=Paenisporosarcina macmurdoensis TaxID=212659 RepID=A0ABW1L4J9_9BACL